MSASAELEAEIRRLHFAEHWKVGTIASQLSVHPEVVQRVLGLPRALPPPRARPGLIDPYADFIDQTLKSYPTLRVTRLYDMLVPRGYLGSVRTLREYVATVRPKHREAFLTLDPFIGEQSQIDWAHVGKLAVPGGARPLWLFLMVLSWSRAMWGELVLDLSVHSLLRSLTRGVAYFQGCTRQWLFDNPKIVVLERVADVQRFHPLLVDLGGHNHVSLRVCPVRRPQQKGRVERAIRYLRDRFFAARPIRSLEQGNQELLVFFDQVAHVRPHPTLAGRTVADCLEEEKGRLLPLPPEPMSTDLVKPVVVDKLGFIQFDTNRYSVEPGHVEGTRTLVADDRTVRVLQEKKEIACHSRNWGRGQRVEDAKHREALMATKRVAPRGKGAGQDRLRTVAPSVDTLFGRWVEDGRNVGSVTNRMLVLLDQYGEGIFSAAVMEVVSRGTDDPGAVAAVCEQARHRLNQPPRVEVPLGNHVPDRDVVPHSLESYDAKSKRRR